MKIYSFLACSKNNNTICTQINKTTNVIHLTNCTVLLYIIPTENIRVYRKGLKYNQERHCKAYF